VFLRDAREYAVPVRAAEVRGSTQGSDGVLLGADVLHEYVRHVVVLDLGSQVYVDLDAVLHVLFFDRVQERVEPLGRAEVADDPCEVDLWDAGLVLSFRSRADRERYLGETRWLGVVEVVHAVPDRLKDTRVQIISKHGPVFIPN
jgi:hypothetical protein